MLKHKNVFLRLMVIEYHAKRDLMANNFSYAIILYNGIVCMYTVWCVHTVWCVSQKLERQADQFQMINHNNINNTYGIA